MNEIVDAFPASVICIVIVMFVPTCAATKPKRMLEEVSRTSRDTMNFLPLITNLPLETCSISSYRCQGDGRPGRAGRRGRRYRCGRLDLEGGRWSRHPAQQD